MPSEENPGGGVSNTALAHRNVGLFAKPEIREAIRGATGLSGESLDRVSFTFNTSGDVQLFEEASLVPALSAPTAIALVLAMLTAGTIRIRQRASPM